MLIRELRAYAERHHLALHTYSHTMTYGPPWDAILRTPLLDDWAVSHPDKDGKPTPWDSWYDSRLLLLKEKLPDWYEGEALIARRYRTQTAALRALARLLETELKKPDSPWALLAAHEAREEEAQGE